MSTSGQLSQLKFILKLFCSIFIYIILLYLCAWLTNIFEIYFHFFLIREEFKVTFADNETYTSAKVVDPNAIQTKNEKVKIKMCTYNGRRTIGK